MNWISCAERLPGQGQKVLLWLDPALYDSLPRFGFLFHDEVGTHWTCAAPRSSDQWEFEWVTHWAEITPPKG